MLWSLIISYMLYKFQYCMLQGLDIELVVYILKLSAMRYLIWKCGDVLTTNYLMRKCAGVPTRVVKLRDLISLEVSPGQDIIT